MSGSSASRWAGGLMGLVAGSFVAILVVGGVAGFLWLYVFGDNPWPPWSGWILAGAAVAVVLAGVVVGVKLGERLKASLAWPLAGVVLLVASSAVSVKVSRDLARTARAKAQEAALAQLIQECHKISAVRAALRGDNSGWDVAVSFTGSRAGAYRLRVSLKRGSVAVLTRESQIELPATDHEMVLPLELSEVISAYEGRVFTRGARNLAVEETAELEYTLEPLLTAAESAQQSASDLQNLRLGHSPLISKKAVGVRVKFELR